MAPVAYPEACWIKYLAQVFPDPGNDAKAVNDPGGSRNFKGPLHHFFDEVLKPFLSNTFNKLELILVCF